MQAVVTMGDTDEDGLLDFREFATYCAEHEKKLWLVFQGLHTNQHGEGGWGTVVREGGGDGGGVRDAGGLVGGRGP